MKIFSLLLFASEKRSVPLTIKGVLKDAPLNSSLRFEILTSLENLKTSDTSFLQTGDWKWFLDAVFFKIPNPADAQHVAGAMSQYNPQQNAARPDWKVSGFQLMPMTTMAAETSTMSAKMQILLECGVVVLFAMFFSVLINKWWLPIFNSNICSSRLSPR